MNYSEMLKQIDNSWLYRIEEYEKPDYLSDEEFLREEVENLLDKYSSSDCIQYIELKKAKKIIHDLKHNGADGFLTTKEVDEYKEIVAEYERLKKYSKKLIENKR